MRLSSRSASQRPARRLRRFSCDISSTHTAILARFPRQLNSSALLYPSGFLTSLSLLTTGIQALTPHHLFTRSIRLRRCRFDISFTHTAILAKFPRQFNSSALLCPSGFLSSRSPLTTGIQALTPRHLCSHGLSGIDPSATTTLPHTRRF